MIFRVTHELVESLAARPDHTRPETGQPRTGRRAPRLARAPGGDTGYLMSGGLCGSRRSRHRHGEVPSARSSSRGTPHPGQLSFQVFESVLDVLEDSKDLSQALKDHGQGGTEGSGNEGGKELKGCNADTHAGTDTRGYRPTVEHNCDGRLGRKRRQLLEVDRPAFKGHCARSRGCFYCGRRRGQGERWEGKTR